MTESLRWTQQEVQRQRAHQTQLDHLMVVVGELVQYVFNQLAPPLPQASAPSAPAPAVHIPIHHASLLELYNGDPAGCRNFIIACKLYFSEVLEIMDGQKVSTLIQRLTERAHGWATAIWHLGGAPLVDYAAFLQQFRAAFDHPDQGKSSNQKLLKLKTQNQDSATEYVVCFCILTAESGWNAPVFITVFCNGFNSKLQTELICRDEEHGLDEIIMLAIKLDQHLRGKQWHSTLLPK